MDGLLNVLHYMQAFYGQILMYLIIHVCIYALLTFGNCLKMIKINQNMLQLCQIVGKNLTLTLVHLLVLLCEMSVHLVL
jgi:hypothetical protein